MCDLQALRAKIHAHLNRSGMAASYFGKQSCGNSEVVPRLDAGGDIYTTTYNRICKYIDRETTRATNQEATPAQP
jgi:hypothetical protein